MIIDCIEHKTIFSRVSAAIASLGRKKEAVIGWGHRHHLRQDICFLSPALRADICYKRHVSAAQVPRVRGVTLGSRMRVSGLLGRSPIPSQIPASVLTMMSQQLAILATRVQELQHNPHFSTVTRHAADHPGEHFLHYAFYKVTMKCDIFILRILIYDLKYFTILRLQNRFTASVLML